MLFGRGGDGHGDDEDLLALEGGDEGVGVIVVDLLDYSAGGDAAGAVGTGDCCDFVFSGFE